MSNSFSDAVREALAKKQAISLPQGKKTKNKNSKKQSSGVPMITGTPVRKPSGRGG